MTNAQAVFERHEKKFLLSPAQYPLLMERLHPHLLGDVYGLHTICSLYYDTPDYAVIRHASSKPVYKEKLRLRSYGVPKGSDRVFLELKKKYRGITYKRRAAMPLRAAEQFVAGGGAPAGDAQTLGELALFLRRHALLPSVCICYDRIAFTGREDTSLRVTVDTGIRFRQTGLDLTLGDYGAPLLQRGYRLLEIKTIAPALPLWLVRICSELAIYPISFSKYGKIYSDYIGPHAEVRHAG